MTDSYVITGHGRCASSEETQVCPEFFTYYLNTTPGSYDLQGRPIMVFFTIKDADLEKYDYRFEIAPDRNRSAVIDSRSLNDSRLGASMDLRDYSDDCSGTTCLVQGTMRMDIKAAGTGLYTVMLHRVDKTTLAKEYIKGQTIDVKIIDRTTANPTASNNRVYNVTVFKSRNYDFLSAQTRYVMGGRKLPEVAEYVFGQGTSNIKMNFSSPYIDNRYVMPVNMDVLALNYRDFERFFVNNTFTTAVQGQLYESIRKRLLDIDNAYMAGKVNNHGFIVTAWFVDAFDFSYSPPRRAFDGKLYTYAQQIDYTDPNATAPLLTDIGLTLRDHRQASYYNGTLVLEANVEKYLTRPLNQRSTSSGVSYWDNSTALGTMAHELGHQWTEAGIKPGPQDPVADPTQCELHKYYCNGLGKTGCLFYSNCVTGEESITLERNTLTTPLFCEGHQQIYMNRLMARDDVF